jgi:hypothetical protein
MSGRDYTKPRKLPKKKAVKKIPKKKVAKKKYKTSPPQPGCTCVECNKARRERGMAPVRAPKKRAPKKKFAKKKAVKKTVKKKIAKKAVKLAGYSDSCDCASCEKTRAEAAEVKMKTVKITPEIAAEMLGTREGEGIREGDWRLENYESEGGTRTFSFNIKDTKDSGRFGRFKKGKTMDKGTSAQAPNNLPHDLIEFFAHRFWEEAGKPEGKDKQFWEKAVKEVKKRAQSNTFFDCWEMCEAVIGRSERVLLYGVSGTGKSYAARKANLNGTEVYSVSLTDETPAAELRGHYGLRGGEYEWMDGPCVKAWRRGSRLVLNELEKASGDSQTFLLGILDDFEIAQQTLPTGEMITPTEGFHVIATMNGNPEEDLEPALRDRFPCCININSVAPGALKNLPTDVRKAAVNTGLVKDPQRKISVRVWNEFVRLRDEFGEQFAASCVFGNKSKTALNHLKVARGNGKK